MTKLNQFESAFTAAAKPAFVYQRVEFRSVLVISDLDETGAEVFGKHVRGFLGVLGDRENLKWRHVLAGDFQTIGDLLNVVEDTTPDLICTYRNLLTSAWKWPYSLGSHLDVLTGFTAPPVLVFPHPKAGRALEHAVKNTDSVMAITDHLVADN